MSRWRYRIKYAVHNRIRHHELAAWRRGWIRAWGWIFDTAWRRVLQPHVTPRRWAKDRYDFLVALRVPPALIGYCWKDEGDWIGEIREDNGPWQMCCFQGDTEAVVRDEILKFLRWAADEAGTQADAWFVTWRNEQPGPHAYTR